MPTIGVSIAVPPPWAQQLQAYREDLGDATARLIPTHITLVPPLEVSATELPAVHEQLARTAAEHGPFRIHLRGTGTFRPTSPVVFIALAEGISGCERLAAGLRRGPLAVELAFPYHPHVTIAHDLGDAALDRAFTEQADFECAFECDHFWLYHHSDAVGWEPTARFDLSGR
ncbi:2'-5' RNA ligase family protein [Nocardioides massiliensis]|uniref:2'-5' RNA ligase n=1 Tax=Nocardioides massiliensis TaxID=1325935 RepID=A0ABT9NQ63_9ACTN|nr:2'-5' RNA ligase family protein [Nocardioides massiliensis]MDP9822195.1 2'-5' RNA ligase [Nocardioides massiliensis]